MFSSKTVLGVVLAAMLTTDVSAHGQMIKPSVRPITSKYRSECLFGLKGAGDEELQIAPLENLSARGQADQPANPNFDMYNGCRGINYEAGMPVTEVTPGQSVQIQYNIAAPHPGYMEMGIVRSDPQGTKMMYKRSVVLTRVENFATNGGGGTPVTITIPSNLAGCSKPGDCALQFYWHSDIAKQTYVNCADIVVKGGGATVPTPAQGSTPNVTPSTRDNNTYTTPAPKKKCNAKK